MILEKEEIYPLLISTTLYDDKYGNKNRFVEMNPSFYIDEDGSYIILVRTVNYMKYPNNSFTVYGDTSRTQYYILRGNIQGGRMKLDDCTAKPLNVIYDIPTFPSYWYGVEDLRCIDKNTWMACIPECNNGTPCIFTGKLEDQTFTKFQRCNPHGTEKNWMPFFWEKYKVVYSVSPFIIKDIYEDTRTTIPMDEPLLHGWHGSSNGIPFQDGILFLIHKNEEKVYSRWLYYLPNKNKIQISEKFTFFRDSYIEFTCSLAKYKEMYYVSLGVNDNKAFLVKLHQKNIEACFTERVDNGAYIESALSSTE